MMHKSMVAVMLLAGGILQSAQSLQMKKDSSVQLAANPQHFDESNMIACDGESRPGFKTVEVSPGHSEEFKCVVGHESICAQLKWLTNDGILSSSDQEKDETHQETAPITYPLNDPNGQTVLQLAHEDKLKYEDIKPAKQPSNEAVHEGTHAVFGCISLEDAITLINAPEVGCKNLFLGCESSHLGLIKNMPEANQTKAEKDGLPKLKQCLYNKCRDGYPELSHYLHAWNTLGNKDL